MILQRGEMSPYFKVEEFVHPQIFKLRGVNSIQHVSEFQINAAHTLRVLAGMAVEINTWHKGGKRVHSGTRPPMLAPKGGGRLSQHYHSRAIDPMVSGLTPKQVHELIFDNFLEFFELGLTTLESLEFTPTWTHMDGRLYDARTLSNIEKNKQFIIVNP
jgi:hypothetical protein